MKVIAIFSIVFSTLAFFFYGKEPEPFHPSLTKTNDSANCAMIKEGETLLQEGDLVVRLSGDPTSQFIKYFNRNDQRYSHSGIVLYQGGYPYIFHMVSGDENPDARLRKDSLMRFCDPQKNSEYGLYRYHLNDSEIKKLKECMEAWYAKGLRFDSLFNLKTDDRMYCSEMIKKGLAKATNNRVQIASSKLTKQEAFLLSAHLRLPLNYTTNLQVVAIDNLYTNAFCVKIKAYVFK